jgi:CheY-like chemotaxis protein/anti-sigma regulatory factor (Ser/Thr protein kinase)
MSLAQMVEDILDVSRVVSGKMRLHMQPVELPLVVHDAVATIMPAAEAKDIRVSTTLDAQVDPVSGDPDRLRQIIWNLLSNAVKFTPKHGRIQVRLERVNSSVEIVVSDTGIGIRPDFLPHIFERFRQADSGTTRVHGGLGLGLAIVRHIVELHRGQVRAESGGEGKGARFVVTLPLQSAEGRVLSIADALPPSLPRPTGLPSLHGIRVLVVDDDADARELLTSVLARSGAVVTAAASAAEALRALDAVWPDVILSDISMPDEDGYQFIRKVRLVERLRGGTVPAIALTANARIEDRARALAAGYQRHMAKPVDPAVLAQEIARIHARATA